MVALLSSSPSLSLTTHVTGREYLNHPPVWRWRLLPGTTTLQQPEQPLTCATAKITDRQQRRSFVGGATDGSRGVACMVTGRM
jgi:hypothetical protein